MAINVGLEVVGGVLGLEGTIEHVIFWRLGHWHIGILPGAEGRLGVESVEDS